MAAAGWTPTVDNYLGRVTKARILEAVREAKGEQSAQLIDHLKKAEMAEEAEAAARRHRLAARAAAHPGVGAAESAAAAAEDPAASYPPRRGRASGRIGRASPSPLIPGLAGDGGPFPFRGPRCRTRYPTLARRLAENAEAVCRHYLSNGRRDGRYWLVGDVRNTPGRSHYVRLQRAESGRGAAGKWTDAATGEHGDLLDLIADSCGLAISATSLDEARRFLEPAATRTGPARIARPGADRIAGSGAAAVRHVAADRGHARRELSAGTRHHGSRDTTALRFHPRCYYRAETTTAAARDLAGDDRRRHRLDGTITGVQRTWLDPRPAAEGAGRHAAAGDGRTCSATPSASARRAT